MRPYFRVLRYAPFDLLGCPNAPGNGRAGRSWPMGGDYSSLAAGPDGSFHLVWADSRTGHFQLRHAELRVEP